MSMRIPSATYRVQFNLNFRFSDAEALVPYLHDLGISDLYASPRFKARKGSSHGYDVADPLRINSELGTEEEFDRLVSRLHQYGMGLLLDIVPNHMAASSENPWWMDVLENGRSSRYAAFFDIDWEPQGIKIATLEKGRVILPILASHYSDILVNQAIRLRFDDLGFFFQYEDHRLPVNPGTYGEILELAAKNLDPADESTISSLKELCIWSKSLHAENGTNVLSGEWESVVPELKAGIWRLWQNTETFRRGIDEALRIFNGIQGQHSSFSFLDSLLSRQSYRLAHWRLAPYEANYRRFFDINDLVGLRTEDPLVFSARHSSIMHLIQEGKVSGLRVDHIDGLFDPLQYLERLKAIPVPSEPIAQDGPRIYTVVEKILCGDEKLPPEWPVAGTTGYNFMNALNALFVHPEGLRDLEESYRRFAGVEESFSDAWCRHKKRVIDELFAADFDLLSHRLGELAAICAQGVDIPVRELICGLKEVTACLPVYRTYCRGLCVSSQDRFFLDAALSDARRRSSSVSESTFGFLRNLFLAELPLETKEDQEKWLAFITRWQQFTGAVMAKGLEDTALFAHHSLLSINEVGNNPYRGQIRFGISAFHEFNRAVLRSYPHTMNTTSTHDTKWSEDMRARLNVLSEMPREWAKCLRRWSRMNKSRKTLVDGRPVPTPNEEVIFYQAMLGIWPLAPFRDVDRNAMQIRLGEFFVKAAREAKAETNWLSPNEEHESALRKFVSSVLAAPVSDPFISDFLRLHRDIAVLGACNSYSQQLLKITAPGVPDFYQGSEFWDLHLTDPDNRQPVDFRARVSVLENLKSQGAALPAERVDELLTRWANGELKLYLIMRLLNFRLSHADLFTKGCYVPIATHGPYRRSVFAFARHFEGQSLVSVAPRLLKNIVKVGTFPLGKIWETTSVEIPGSLPRKWKDALTGEEINLSAGIEGSMVPVAQLFGALPFAVLSSVADG